MRDKPFFAAGMRDAGSLKAGGKQEVSHSHGGTREFLIFSGRETGWMTTLHSNISRFHEAENLL